MRTPLEGPIAYLTGEYPRATDTFIQREVKAIRTHDQEVLTCSIRQTPVSDHVGEEQKREFSQTYQVQKDARNPLTLLTSHAYFLLRHPRGWWKGFAVAAKTCPAGFKGFFWQVFYFLQAGVLARYLVRKKAAHLHNHFGNSSCSVAMMASKISGIPYSYTMHGPMEFFEPMYWRIDEKVAGASMVACISHYARGQGMIFADQKHWPKMKIVHCGVDPALYTQNTAAPGKRLIFVGRMAAIKGVAVLLTAVHRLLKTYPDLSLTLVGDGPEMDSLKEKARALGLEDCTTFTGYLSQKDVAKALSDADVFVLPSFAEGVPVVLMEAMAASKPVIAPHVAGVPELVTQGESGFLVSPGDADGLFGAIDTVLSDPGRAVAMGQAGREKVKQEFNAALEGEWLLRLIESAHMDALPEGLRP